MPGLEQVSAEIRRIATYLNPRIQALELRKDASQASELDHARHLRECVRSSASIISSTSTIMGGGGGDSSSLIADSDFGDCFPEPPSEHMMRWITSSTIHEDNLDTTQLSDYQIPGSAADFTNDSDSDGDLEADMTSALFRSGNEKLAAQDYQSAERLLKSCSSRLSLGSSPLVSPSSSKNAVSKLEVLNALCQLYLKQRNWEQAQIILTERISLAHSSGKGGNTTETLGDVLLLANILMQNHKYSDAHLQTRRAFTGYKRLGMEGRHGAEQALKMLIKICTAEGKPDELEAYELLLTELLQSSSSQQTFQQTEELSLQSSSLSPEVVGPAENREAKLNIAKQEQEHVPSSSGGAVKKIGEASSEAISSMTSQASSNKDTVVGPSINSLQRHDIAHVQRLLQAMPRRKPVPLADATTPDGKNSMVCIAFAFSWCSFIYLTRRVHIISHNIDRRRNFLQGKWIVREASRFLINLLTNFRFP